jgi:hypothetical protein
MFVHASICTGSYGPDGKGGSSCIGSFPIDVAPGQVISYAPTSEPYAARAPLAGALVDRIRWELRGDDAALAIENHNAMVRAAMLTEEAHTQVHAALAELTHTSAAEDSSARSVVARKSETAAREASSAAAAAAAEATNGVDGADRRRQDQAEAARRVREAKRAVAAEMRREREQARGEDKAQQNKVQSAVAGARSALGDTATLDDQRNAVIHQLTGTLHHDDGGVTTVAELQRMSNSRLLEMHGQISIGARRNAMIAQLAGTIDTDGTSLTIAQLQAMGNAEIAYKFDRIRSSNALAAEQLRSSHGDNPMSRSSTSGGKKSDKAIDCSAIGMHVKYCDPLIAKVLAHLQYPATAEKCKDVSAIPILTLPKCGVPYSAIWNNGFGTDTD